MKIFDCFMFYDEELLLDIRMNILDKYVDFFVIVESEFFHNGKKRNLKFNINNYPKFKNKIIYIIKKKEPDGIWKINNNESEDVKSHKSIENSHIRENDQRNHIIKGLDMASDNDLILISDVDEIPNFESIDLSKVKNQIIMFVQEIFYYKFDRYLPGFQWFGTKGCKKKYLISPQWLRNIKNKKFSFWRIDTFFSKTRYINKIFIKNGGWHFSFLQTPQDIAIKIKSYSHGEFNIDENTNEEKIKQKIRDNKDIFDRGFKLKKIAIDKSFPDYIVKNQGRLKDWIL